MTHTHAHKKYICCQNASGSHTQPHPTTPPHTLWAGSSGPTSLQLSSRSDFQSAAAAAPSVPCPPAPGIMALNVPGLVATLIFYVLVLAIGLWASLRSRRDQARTQAAHTDMALLGNRRISLLVGIFTTTGESPPAVFLKLLKKKNFLPGIASVLAMVQTSTFLKKEFLL